MKHSTFARLVFVLALIATIIGVKAFSQEKANPDSSKLSQTEGQNAKRLDQLDFELKQLNVQMDQLNSQLKNIDFSKAQRQIDEAMKKLNAKNISEKINQSLQNIEWEKMNKHLEENVAKIDKVKMMEIRKEMNKVKEELRNQKLDMKITAPTIDVKRMKIETEKAMQNARKSMEKAKSELTNLRDFTNALQSDGLINKSKGYKVEVKEGELYINGTKQSKEISDKYKKYYKKDNFTINMNGENNIRI